MESITEKNTKVEHLKILKKIIYSDF